MISTSKWTVVPGDSDIRPESEAWTVSKTQFPGWNTDGGYDGYGLTKADAAELATAANMRDEALELLRRVDHTLTAHGQLHAGTPLHVAIQLLLPEGWV